MIPVPGCKEPIGQRGPMGGSSNEPVWIQLGSHYGLVHYSYLTQASVAQACFLKVTATVSCMSLSTEG